MSHISQNEPSYAHIWFHRFLYAPTSWDRLNVTLDMAQQIFSYHQVMPAFMESIFSFGFREHGLDCNETSFNANHQLERTAGEVQVIELGRSGCQLQHCYGLRSVERSNDQPDWPWSTRQSSIYHSLDLDSAQATWIVVKANRLIEKYTRDALGDSRSQIERPPGDVGRAIAASLPVHELVASWSGSNWQGYITFIESRLQSITRPALSVTTEDISSPEPDHQRPEFHCTASPTQMLDGIDELDEKLTPLRRTTSSFKTFYRRASSFISRRDRRPEQEKGREIRVLRHKFTFDDLPRLHFLEEKANEALDVLCNNAEVVTALKADYVALMGNEGLCSHSDELEVAYSRFISTIDGVQRNYKKQQARLKQLLRLIANRKVLVRPVVPLPVSLAYIHPAQKNSRL